MRIDHIPADDVNKTIDLGQAVDAIMKRARKHISYRVSRSTVMSECGNKCRKCKAVARDVHHSKPLWADVTEYVIANCPKFSDSDVKKVAVSTSNIDHLFEKWNSPNNLIPVCAKCHTDMQKFDDRFWRMTLGKRHRLVYIKAWQDKFIRIQLNKDCPPFSEYVENYLNRKIELW